jgi:hypothetical protein
MVTLITSLRKHYPKSIRGRVVLLLACAFGLFLLDSVLLFPIWHAFGVRPFRAMVAAKGSPTLAAYVGYISLYVTDYSLSAIAGGFLGAVRGRKRWLTDALAFGAAFFLLPWVPFFLTVSGTGARLVIELPLCLSALVVPIVLVSAWVGARLSNLPDFDREHCPACGYSTKFLPAMRCPECGTDLTEHLVARPLLPGIDRTKADG